MKRILILLAVSAPLVAEQGYHINELNDSLELVTPYGKKVLMGNFGLNGNRAYKIEIPLTQIIPPDIQKEQSELARRLASIEEGQEKLSQELKESANQRSLEPAREKETIVHTIEKSATEHTLSSDKDREKPGPSRVVVEYDDSDRLVLEANRLYNRGKFYESSMAVDELLRKNPTHVRGWIMKGSLMQVQGHKEMAQTAWKKAIELNPQHPDVQGLMRRVR